MNTLMPRNDLFLLLGFAIVVLAMPIWLAPFGAGYPDLDRVVEQLEKRRASDAAR